MPLGLMAGRPFNPFQTGDLFTLLADNLFQGGNLAEQLNQQSLKLWTAQIGERRWRGHVCKESYSFEPSKQKNERLPTLLPLLRVNDLCWKGMSCLSRLACF